MRLLHTKRPGLEFEELPGMDFIADDEIVMHYKPDEKGFLSQNSLTKVAEDGNMIDPHGSTARITQSLSSNICH